jgi:peptidoglycan/LPS O-acetylase OafA/YrhL
MSSSAGAKLSVLEGLRGFAASYVVLHHISPLRGTSAEWLTRFGQEAVTVFFLLSGFVIHYSFASARDRSARSYFIKRVRRIYPPFLIALALTALVRVLIRGPGADLEPEQLALNILMLQDSERLRPGSIVEPYLNNVVLWSLSYEWWFYVLYYPIATRLRPQRWLPCVAAIVGAGLIAFAIAPSYAARVAMFFGVWWLGVELARAYLAHGKVELRAVLPGMALATALAAALLLNALWVGRSLPMVVGRYPWIEPRIVSVAVALAAIGLIWHRFEFRGGRRVLAVGALVAPISYGLYVFHLPLLSLRSHFPALQGAGGLAVVVGAAALLAYAVEVRLQPMIHRWLR